MEHVVEVPTILYFLKQTVDIPVPRGVVGGPQGFFPLQSSSSSTEQIVHTPVRGRGVSGGSLKRTAEQIADIPIPGGERSCFPSRSSSVSSPCRSAWRADSRFFFFRTFPRIIKKCDDQSAPGVATGCGLHFIHDPWS